jgi:N-acetyl-alpha-D-muramate 1-phosphate uridylyltransferase
MILAAGRGERMGVLTATLPKPLLEVAGKPLIEHHVARLAAAGVDAIVINLSYRGAQIRDYLGDGRRFGIGIEYSEEGEPPLETAGGIVSALPLLGEKFLLVNSDVFTDFDCRALLDAREPTLVLVGNPAHNPRGDFGLDAGGRVRAEPRTHTYAGIALLEARMFAGLPAGRRPLKPVLDAAIARDALAGVRFDGLWMDVGTPERLAAARAVAGEK